jgi:hypothetical protein
MSNKNQPKQQAREPDAVISGNSTPGGNLVDQSLAIAENGGANLPEHLRGRSGPARGSEEVGAKDLIIPRLEVVQALSPCRKKGDPNYIEGAEEGMLYNNVTRQIYGQQVVVVPVYFKKEFLLWKDRQKGGGFRGAFPGEAEAESARLALEADEREDVEAVDTAQHFCLLLDKVNNKAEEIVISMAKSKMKVSRKWNSLIRLSNDPDSFARAYRIGTVVEKNSKNQDYHNLSIAALGFVPVEIYRRAEKLYEAIKSGSVGINRTIDPGEDIDGNNGGGANGEI